MRAGILSIGLLRPLFYSRLGLLQIAAITTLVLVGYSAWGQIGPRAPEPRSPVATVALPAPPPDAQPQGELKAMLARVRLRLGGPQAELPGNAPPPGGRDAEPSASRAEAAGITSPFMVVAQLQRDLQAVRSLQAVLVRKLAETRDSLAAADRRSVALDREVADLRARVVSASDEIQALRDRVQPAPPVDTPQRPTATAAATDPNMAPAPEPPETVPRDAAPLPQVLARLDGSVFRTGSAELQPEAATRLAAAGRFIAAHPAVRVRIVGHTDASGDDQRNLELSGRRAEAVRAYLADRFDLPESRLLAEGKGELEPIASNETAAGRQANRRVEIYVRP